MYYLNRYKKKVRTILRNLINNPDPKSFNSVPYLNIGLIDPSIGTTNLGDLIILDAVQSNLKAKYPKDMFTHFPSQLYVSFEDRYLLNKMDWFFVSGTNLLSSNMDVRNQWKISPGHKKFMKNNVILHGVGWWQYQGNINKYSEKLYKSILSTKHYHSVRDSYTEQKLKSIGIQNVLNTTCPTLWSLTPEHCQSIPKQKRGKVVTTLTFYKADKMLDEKMMQLLIMYYSEVFLWVQGLNDVHYLKTLNIDHKKVSLVAPNIESFNNILNDPDIEYVGTRLHAGVRALQKRKRTLILAVDNRALEIARDTNLNVINREEVEKIKNFVDAPYTTIINLPNENIKLWFDNLPKNV